MTRKVSASEGLGSKLLTCNGVCVDAPSARRVLQDFSYEFLRKDRVGIVGPNGAGKTTFLRALQGQLPLAAGGIEAGDTLAWGHYEQQGLQELPEDKRVLEFVQEVCEKCVASRQI